MTLLLIRNTLLTATSGESFDDVPHEKRQIGKIAITSCSSGQLSNNHVSQDSLAQCSSSSTVLSELGAYIGILISFSSLIRVVPFFLQDLCHPELDPAVLWQCRDVTSAMDTGRYDSSGRDCSVY